MFKNIYYGWWIVLACFLNAFYVAGIIFYGFTAFVEPLVAEFGWSYAQISFAASLRGLEMGILAPLVGFMVDRFGSRRLLLLGVILVGCGIMLLGYTHSLSMFYASFLLIAFGAGGCTSVVTMTAVANWFDKNVGKAMGVMASGFGASGLMVPLIVWLIATYGWRKTTFILGVGMWVFGIPLSFILRERPEKSGFDRNERPGDKPSQEKPETATATEIGFKTAIRNRSFLWACLAEVVRMMSLASVVTHIMPYLGGLGVSRGTSGVMAAAVPLLSILGRFSFGWLGDIFEKKRVMAFAYACMGLGMLSFAFADITGLIYLFLFLFSSGFGGLAVLRGSLLREYYGRHSFGKLMGILMGSGAMGGIIGPTLSGWVFDRYGTYRFVWLFLCAMIGIAIFLILKIESRQKPAKIETN
jgi:MFS family permease